MTQGGINDSIAFNNFNGVVGTDFHAFSAPGAVVRINKKLSAFHRPLAGY
jgi:hypothetical protein